MSAPAARQMSAPAGAAAVMSETAARRRAIRAHRAMVMRRGLSPAAMTGLEIGPLANPLIMKSEGPVTYVDHSDAEALRATYKDDPGIDIAHIVDVDAIWGERPLRDCVGGARFEYVLASHVAEHVPDLITWLGEINDVLNVGGQLRLVMPDCRFGFDVLRQETRLLDLLTNRVLRARRPQVRDVLDFRLHFAPGMDDLGRFEGRFDIGSLRPEHSFDVAIAAAGWARDLPDRYFDVHCSVFQPRSFAQRMAELAGHGLLDFRCTELIDTAPPGFEFFVFMQHCDDPASAVGSWQEAASAMRDPLPGSAEEAALLVREAERRQERSRQDLLADRLAAAERDLAALRSSTSWQVTAPMRWLRRRLG